MLRKLLNTMLTNLESKNINKLRREEVFKILTIQESVWNNNNSYICNQYYWIIITLLEMFGNFKKLYDTNLT